MTTLREVQITFDCANPRRVAAFWAQALGYVVPEDAAGVDAWSVAQDPTGAGPRLFFQQVPEPKTVKNRVHLDVRVGTGLVGEARLAALNAEADRLETHGARRIELLLADEENESTLVMADVEGNEFCLD